MKLRWHARQASLKIKLDDEDDERLVLDEDVRDDFCRLDFVCSLIFGSAGGLYLVLDARRFVELYFHMLAATEGFMLTSTREDLYYLYLYYLAATEGFMLTSTRKEFL